MFMVSTLDDNPLPDGTFPIFLSQVTQEKFECIAEWDLSMLEPQKIIPIEKIREDLKDPDSDFATLKEQIKVSMCIGHNRLIMRNNIKMFTKTRYFFIKFFIYFFKEM